MKLSNYTERCLINWKQANKGGKTHLLLGIQGEFGEVCDTIKKYIRGDFKKDQFKSNVKKELGDMTWYVAVYAHEEGISDLKLRQPRSTRILDSVKSITKLNSMLLGAENKQQKRLITQSLLNKTTDLAWSFGFQMDEILQANVKKMDSRLSNGTIKGSGNDR